MDKSTFENHQADMRAAYAFGAPGVFVSSVVWLGASIVCFLGTTASAVWVLLIGGAAIYPVSLLACRAVGASAKHSTSNPLSLLAIEGTVWLIAGILISLAVSSLRIELFFPVMLLVIGSRYLTFQSLYGLKAYWFGGGALCTAGVLAATMRLPPPLSAAAGAGIELALAAVLFALRRRRPGAV